MTNDRATGISKEKEKDGKREERDRTKGGNDENTLLDRVILETVRPIRLRTDYYVFLTRHRLNLNTESYPLIRSAIREFSTTHVRSHRRKLIDTYSNCSFRPTVECNNVANPDVMLTRACKFIAHKF